MNPIEFLVIFVNDAANLSNQLTAYLNNVLALFDVF